MRLSFETLKHQVAPAAKLSSNDFGPIAAALAPLVRGLPKNQYLTLHGIEKLPAELQAPAMAIQWWASKNQKHGVIPNAEQLGSFLKELIETPVTWSTVNEDYPEWALGDGLVEQCRPRNPPVWMNVDVPGAERSSRHSVHPNTMELSRLGGAHEDPNSGDLFMYAQWAPGVRETPSAAVTLRLGSDSLLGHIGRSGRGEGAKYSEVSSQILRQLAHALPAPRGKELSWPMRIRQNIEEILETRQKAINEPQVEELLKAISAGEPLALQIAPELINALKAALQPPR